MQFRVAATNAEGTGIPSTASVVVTTKRLRRLLKPHARNVSFTDKAERTPTHLKR